MPGTIEEWISHVKDKPLPVLSYTLDRLENLCQRDDAPIKEIVDEVERDPGLTAQLLRRCNDTEGHKLDREISSVQQAVMLVGTQQLKNIAKELPVLENNFSEAAQKQILRTFCRAYHAGYQAVYWAKLRRDMTPDEVFAVSQLHFLGEMILAIHAPEQLLAVFELRREKSISYEEAQYITLGFTFDQLSLAIARAWQLPELVREALLAENASNPRGFGIMMAVQLARGAAIDWYSEKMSSIYEHVSELLDIPVDDIIRQSHKLAVEIARQTLFYKVMQSASLLPLIKSKDTTSAIKQSVTSDYDADICLTPRVNALKVAMDKLKLALSEKQTPDKILHICLEGLHDGVGLNRVVYSQLDNNSNSLVARAIIGADNDPVFNRFSIQLSQAHLFQQLISKPQAIYINDKNRKQFWSLVPPEFQKLIGTNSFAAMSIFLNNKLHGLVYADRHTSSCQIDVSSYNYFKKLCNNLSTALGMAKSH